MAGATVTKKYAYHGTLDGTDVDNVTLTQSNPTFTIVNRSANSIYFTVDGTVPTVAGDNTFVCPTGLTIAIPVLQPATANQAQPAGTTVKLIAGSSSAYSVEAL
jgi:hypothetical protein